MYMDNDKEKGLTPGELEIYLKDAIIEQKIEPNRRLRERDIAKQFGISTTPVI